MRMARIQHLAIASLDPEKQAEFYKEKNYRPKRSDKFKGPENALFDIADHLWIGAGPVKQGAK
jgi:hypothetical protein